MTSDNVQQKRFRMLYKLEAWLEGPMFMLAIVWLYLFIVELARGLSPVQEKLVVLIWFLFVLEFTVKLALSTSKVDYVKRNWLIIMALFIPAIRVFRLLRAIRVLQLSRIVTTNTFVRGLTPSNQFLNELKNTQEETPAAEMHVGVLLAYSPAVTPEGMEPFLKQLTLDVQPEMTFASGIPWTFHLVEPVALKTDRTREPSDFLDAATMRMAEGPYDIVLVVTDVTLISRRDRIEAGIASPVTYTAVISTQRLTTTPRGKPIRTLGAETVRVNAAALTLHLLGHISGLPHTERRKGGVMAPFSFREGRKLQPEFTEKERALLKEQVKHLPERELHGGTGLEAFIFHLIMAVKHPKAILSPLLRNWAILLPLSLPGLATAAVAPSLLLIFSAEIWDVGLNMGNRTTTLFAAVSILGASFYLIKIQSLFLPRKEKNVLTEHQAIANVVIFLSILLACFGLFLMIGGLMMVIELYVFPEGLISTWPTLDKPMVGLTDKLRLAAFISTVGVTTGALAGGLEKKTVIQHLALFLNKP
ncbi:hypothetical protein [Pontibacter cellulosilyticus]|uniref:Uncharacterized protein n=1 Tax=Pontibacter cellulosilyticus TaxID=1720253 RepID=A0A923N5I0_9BACT|nr:hypothetical protein [Pontibacter cellulosilyticus]MBC5992219.1 hypothetical protein [Pontibacter cellulosilyticus]